MTFEVEHYLMKLLDSSDNDLRALRGTLRSTSLDCLPNSRAASTKLKSGNARTPAISPRSSRC